MGQTFVCEAKYAGGLAALPITVAVVFVAVTPSSRRLIILSAPLNSTGKAPSKSAG